MKRAHVVCCAGLLALVAAATTAAQTPTKPVDQAFQLYVAVATGKRTWQSLTPAEQREVAVVAAAMRKPAHRYTSQKCEDLANAQDQLEGAAEDLRQCAANGDDDCGVQAQNVASAQSDYQDAFDAAEDDCQ
jgi:hypothetical protein